jgi:hypothetical protein
MSAISLPVSRPQGQALIVGQHANCIVPQSIMRQLGVECSQAADAYEAMSLICRQPTVFSTVVLSLHSLYREELQIIASIRNRFPFVEIWVSDSDGRQLALTDALKLGADGLLDQDGLHRRDFVISPTAPDVELASKNQVNSHDGNSIDRGFSSATNTDPLLTADELRALLADVPVPAGEQES